MRAGVERMSDFPCRLPMFNGIPTTSHHVELSLYAEETAITATPRGPKLLVSHGETNLSDLER